ncbi:hypothetical protein HN935_02815 [archaeon]|nr:hypothetical protein [archaeon]
MHLGAGEKAMNAHRRTAQIVTVIVLVLVSAMTMMTSGCVDVRDAEYKTSLRFGRIRTSLGDLRHKSAKGSETTLMTPFAEKTQKPGGVENIMD